MARSCTVCAHPDLSVIDRALVESTPKRRIAARFGVTEQALRRHAATHLPALLVRAAESTELARADDLVGLAKHLQAEALEVLERAKAADELGGVLQAIDRLQKGIALLSTLAGLQDAGREITVRFEYCPHHPDRDCGSDGDPAALGSA